MQSQVSTHQPLKPRNKLRESPLPWLVPLLLILIVVFLFPVIEIIRLSFTDSTLVDPNYSYTLSSYLSLFNQPGFQRMMWITLLFVVFSVSFQLILGLLVALAIDQGQKRNLKGTIAVRTAVLTAWAIPGVVIGVIWRIMYNETEAGILNFFVSTVSGTTVPFLSDPTFALVAVILANIWRGTAFSMILIYGGLQTLPKDILESARIDGANAIKRLTKIILPILAPIIMINLVIISIDTFNTFDMVMALTGGGPGQSTEIIALSIYNLIFREFNLGQGAAAAVVLLTINIIMTLVYLKILGREGRS
ncbi:carbohydrate ABC transporter permease [Geomicrobium sp. JCM 19039]|uniref:carbohydrate ABC transporter permease n=1 Tax=Geomicrobium sp. JCM 19039 TaxID=1460636 RepID=UPI00045F33EE|nr:sugar ABC transporter permease [Geomicrobium sp. JCM 19039]GAK13236.1 possible alpha-xyloside ABC transporter, permease component [Geomicrobium sp. JCM 19039]